MLRKPDILNSAYEKYAVSVLRKILNSFYLNISFSYFTPQRRYNKKSNPARKRIFKSRLLTIFAHNLRAKKGEETYTMGINQFSDMVQITIQTNFQITIKQP